MAFKPMRTALLVVLVVAVAIAAALEAPFAGAKAKVSIQLSPSPAGVRVEVESTTSRPLVLFLDGRRVSSRTGTGLTVTVPLRFVSLDSSRIVVRDGTSRSVLASQTFSGRYFLKPQAPRLALTATPMGPTTARTATISWRTNGGRTSCAIDGRAPIACASPLRLDGLDLGRHDVSVTVFAHNSDSSVRAIWTVRQEPTRNEALRHRQHPEKPVPARTKTATPMTATTTPTPPPPSAPPTTAAATTPSTPSSTPTPTQQEARVVATGSPTTTTATTATTPTTTSPSPVARVQGGVHFHGQWDGPDIDNARRDKILDLIAAAHLSLPVDMEWEYVGNSKGRLFRPRSSPEIRLSIRRRQSPWDRSIRHADAHPRRGTVRQEPPTRTTDASARTTATSWPSGGEPMESSGPGNVEQGERRVSTGRRAQYVALLKSAYTSIKAAQPATTVVTGGLVANDDAYVKAMCANGAKDFDVLALHPYQQPSGAAACHPGHAFRRLELHAAARSCSR